MKIWNFTHVFFGYINRKIKLYNKNASFKFNYKIRYRISAQIMLI